MEKKQKKDRKDETELERKERDPDMICGIDETAFYIFLTVGICIGLIVIVILAIKLSNPNSSSQADLDERTSSLKTKPLGKR